MSPAGPLPPPLPDLLAPARAAAQAADAGAAADLLAQAATATAAPERSGGARAAALAVLDLNRVLAGLGPPNTLLSLYLAAQDLLSTAADAPLDDFLRLWEQMAALYDSYGEHGARDAVLAHLYEVAQADRPAQRPLGEPGAGVLLRLAERALRLGLPAQLLAVLPALHRYHMAAAASDDDRRSWLELHVGLLNRQARDAFERDDPATALAALERALPLVGQAPLAGSALEAGISHNAVAAVLQLRDASRYPAALAWAGRAVALLQQRGQQASNDHAYALYQQALLHEYTGRWPDAAAGYEAAAAVADASADDRLEWLALAGRAWLQAGVPGRASACYLRTVRQRVAAAAAR